MGLTCSKDEQVIDHQSENANDVPDPVMYDFMKRSVISTQQLVHSGGGIMANDSNNAGGQYHLLYKHQQQQHKKYQQSKNSGPTTATATAALEEGIEIDTTFPTRMMVRRHAVRSYEEGVTGTHIYAIRWAEALEQRQEQCPGATQKLQQQMLLASTNSKSNKNNTPPVMLGQEDRIVVTSSSSSPTITRQVTSAPVLAAPDSSSSSSNQAMPVDHLFQRSTMASPPKRKVLDWVTVSEENNIYVADVGLSVAECDRIVAVTEQVCRGQYAAYTYAKQTLGCREFPTLAVTVQEAVHTITHAILEFSQEHQQGADTTTHLALDDREPHMVKYDVTKRERQKLDMHTDKSEWTFLISLSNGCGMDYTGGGTYFECLDSTVHVQRGHALIFPGKLRHCGQRITSGLRFLLVGFLVDKSPAPISKYNKTEKEDHQQQQQKQYVNNVP